jgi:hypothetical protein
VKQERPQTQDQQKFGVLCLQSFLFHSAP